MLLVDTSVWVHALRPAGSRALKELLKPLIAADQVAATEWILLELMTGLRTTERKESLLRWFSPIQMLSFDKEQWVVAWSHAATLRRHGVTVTAADCFIATVAILHRATLVHCDSDFETMRAWLPLQTQDWTGHLEAAL